MSAIIRRWADGLVDAATEDDDLSEVDSIRVHVAVQLYRISDLLERVSSR